MKKNLGKIKDKSIQMNPSEEKNIEKLKQHINLMTETGPYIRMKQ